ncbi:MAG: hypothetical protein JWR02_2510 [Mucilaginibacter sp.]|nr:hypothetical protein [Mucilaginibacter sp.]
MKIINIHRKITIGELYALLQEKLNPQFHQQRESDISFNIENAGTFVEINQPALYEEYLFRIAIQETKLLITRQADYIDDVNALTIESILNGLFEELAGDTGITFVLEG